MLLAFCMFDNSFFNILTIIFTALILSEMLNVTSEVK